MAQIKSWFNYLYPNQACRVAGVPWQLQILADQLALSQPRGANYAHQIILAPPDFQTLRQPWLSDRHVERLVVSHS